LRATDYADERRAVAEYSPKAAHCAAASWLKNSFRGFRFGISKPATRLCPHKQHH
jgi:hypothetical protein